MKVHHFIYVSFLYIIVLLKYPIVNDNLDREKFIEFARKDIEFCPKCFQQQLKECENFENEIDFSNSLQESLNAIFGVRQTRYGAMKQIPYTPIVVKYLGKEEKFTAIQREISHLSDDNQIIQKLSTMYFDEMQVDGSQFCPKHSKLTFLQLFSSNYTELDIWTILNVNIQPLLLPLLNDNGFSVPRVLRTCGFTIYETFDGQSLSNYYKSSFRLKLKISIQLLIEMLKFTKGINGYRFYLTDATMDNIVYNEKIDRVSFVDLDNVLIVDSKAVKNQNVHKHVMIECDGCFAYAPSDVCMASKSDINLFSICQFLREDLHKNRKMGFLYPIPEDIDYNYPDLMNLLNFCVDCPSELCNNRFDVVVSLMDTIRIILNNNEFLY